MKRDGQGMIMTFSIVPQRKFDPDAPISPDISMDTRRGRPVTPQS
jgi:hypothetical protein